MYATPIVNASKTRGGLLVKGQFISLRRNSLMAKRTPFETMNAAMGPAIFEFENYTITDPASSAMPD